MDDKIKRHIAYVCGVVGAFVIGIIPAFFIVLNSIFSDGGALTERLLTFAYVILVYGVLGTIFGAIWPRMCWKWGIPLSLSAVGLVILYTISEPYAAVLNIIYLVLTFAAASLGACIGYLIRKPKSE
jgi:hypothetical protein